MKNIFLFLGILFFLSAGSVRSAVFFVKTGGDNALAGTNWPSAWRSVGYAASNALSGDTVIVSNGAYNEEVVIPKSGISFISAERGQAVIAGVTNCFNIAGRSNILIEGFVCKKAARNGILITGPSGMSRIVHNEIFSNILCGLRIDSGPVHHNHIVSNYIWNRSNASEGSALNIASGFSNLLEGNSFRNAIYYSIYLRAGAHDNLIRKNTIWSNGNTCIWIMDDGSDHNVIRSNTLSRSGAQGIVVAGGDHNIIEENTLSRNTTTGIVLTYDSLSNIIRRNRICSNNATGVYIDHENSGWNLFQNNRIFGPSQNIGLRFVNPDNNLVEGNSFFSNGPGGAVVLDGAAVSNSFRNNIFSNTSSSGVYINSDTAAYNTFCSNRFFSQFMPVRVNNADHTLISRNLFKTSPSQSIQIAGSASNTGVVNNTIFGTAGSALFLSDTSSGYILNNIMLSNAEYGITNYSSGSYTVDYNCLFGNGKGDFGGIITNGPHNIFQDPEIAVLSDCMILAGESPAVDSAIAVPGITEGYDGSGPDMGWKEWISPPRTTGDDSTNQTVKRPDAEVRLYNNLLDLSQGEPVRIIFGTACFAEIRIYNLKGVLVKSWEKRHYNPGEYQEWSGTVRESGKKTGAGIYFVLIKGDVNKKLKLIVKK